MERGLFISSFTDAVRYTLVRRSYKKKVNKKRIYRQYVLENI